MRLPHLDFINHIHRSVNDLIGRKWLLRNVSDFLQQNGDHYLIITGEPGIGKSTIAAHLVQTRTIHAYHFCNAREGGTLDPLAFVRSVSQHLTQKLPDFGRYLVVEEERINIDVDISIHEIGGGVVHGVYIGELIAQTRSTEEAFQRLVREPLKAWAAERIPDEKVVLLVDALDEAARLDHHPNIIDLIDTARDLPESVYWILTSRPGNHLNILPGTRIAIIDNSAENIADVRAYVSTVLDTPAMTSAFEANGVDITTFSETLVQRSGGNFLYLRYVLADLQRRITDGEAPALEHLPFGLDGVYQEFLHRVLAKKRDEAWRQVYRPVLGILAVAQEALSFEQLVALSGVSPQDVNDVVTELVEFFDATPAGETDRYRIYHTSFADFLADRERNPRHWINPVDHHAQIASHYLSMKTSRWTNCDAYGFKYLTLHLVEGNKLEDLYGLIEDPVWTSAKFVDTPWVDSLVQDLHRVSALKVDGDVEELTRLMAYQLRRALVEELMSSISRKAILFLAKLGRVEQALDFARRNDWYQFNLIRDIARIVAPTEPAKALEILVGDLARWADDKDTLSQCKARLAAATEILQLLSSSFSNEAQRLIERVHNLQSKIPESERITYQIEWLIPTLVLKGDSETATEMSDNLPLLQKAQAIRHTALVLPDTAHPEKKRSVEHALEILETLEQSPESANEKMKTITALLPLVEESRQEVLISSLEAAGDYLQKLKEPRSYDWTQGWVIDQVAKVNLSWAKRMLLESEWDGVRNNDGREVLLEIAKINVEEALQLFKERFEIWFGSSQTLADIIGIVALEDTDKAEALINEYIRELRRDEQAAYLALAEGYLVQGNRERAEDIFHNSVFSVETGGIIRDRCELQLAILKYASAFISPEQAQSRLMKIPTSRVCYDVRQKAGLVLAHIAGRNGNLEFLKQHVVSEDAKIQGAYALAEYVSPEVAREFIERNHIRLFIGKGPELDAFIAVLEAQQDPTRLQVLLKHFEVDEQVHHLCAHMVRFPDALRWLVRDESINIEEAKGLIEEIAEFLREWQCPRQNQIGTESETTGDRCSCYERRDQVVSALIGVMAELDLERAEQLAELLPVEVSKLSSLIQIFHVQPSQQLLGRIVTLAHEIVGNPWQKTQFFYDLAAAVAQGNPGAVNHLFELAEVAHREAQRQQRAGIRIGPTQATFNVAKGQALARLIETIDQLPRLAEVFEAIGSLLQLEDKLRALDPLLDQALTWRPEDQLTLLWHLNKLAATKKLVDVQAIIALSVPLVESLAGEGAFWRLYEYVEWAYEGLPLESIEGSSS